MTTRGGFTKNGIHFNQTDSTRSGSPQTFFFLNGKRAGRNHYSQALAAAKAAEMAALATEATARADQAQADRERMSAVSRQQTARDATPTKAPRMSLRDAAYAVVNGAGMHLEPSEMATRIHNLALALNKAPARAPAEPREPRGDSKQAMVITMMKRPEGATNPEIQTATGWQPHTVRGFFAGLQHKGHSVHSSTEEGRGRVYRIPTGGEG